MNKNKKQSVNELDLEQRKLNNLQMATNMKLQEFRMACDKIEQARRNVEVITKVYNSFDNDDDKEIQGKMKEVLLSNLEMLKETNKL